MHFALFVCDKFESKIAVSCFGECSGSRSRRNEFLAASMRIRRGKKEKRKARNETEQEYSLFVIYFNVSDRVIYLQREQTHTKHEHTHGRYAESCAFSILHLKLLIRFVPAGRRKEAMRAENVFKVVARMPFIHRQICSILFGTF